MTTPLLEARNLSHVYQVRTGLLSRPAPLRALNGVSLTVMRRNPKRG